MNPDLENLDLAANLSQFYSLFLLLKDATNNEIMRELQNQNTNYFDNIIQKLNEMDKRLTEIEKRL